MSDQIITPTDRLEKIPFSPSLTSSNLGWSSVRLEDYRFLPASSLSLPPMNHHIIALHYKPPTTTLKHSCAGKFSESVLSHNDITYVPANADNSWEFDGDRPHCLHILIDDCFFRNVALTAFDTDPSAIEAIGRFKISESRLPALAQLLHKELYHSEQMGSLYAEHITTAMTLALLENHSTLPLARHKPVLSQLNAYQLRRVIELMKCSLEQGLSLQQMADEVGLSTFHFSRQFKASMGISPARYFLHLRLDEAKSLIIKSPSVKLSSVAQQTGFSDQAYLARQFSKRFGMTPANFRSAGSG